MAPPIVLKTSLDHLPPDRSARVRAAAEAIRREAPVDLIVLFGSYARGDWVRDVMTGYRSDFDFLVVVESKAIADDVSLWGRAEEAARAASGDTPVSLIVHDRRSLNDQIRLSNYLFIDALHEGVCLFDSRRFQLARPKALTKEERLALGEDHFRYWFGSANVFFRNCRYSEVQGRRAEAAFFLHQAAERYSHALLLVFTAYKPKTHSLIELGEQVEKEAPAVAGALPRGGSERDKDLFNLLRDAYIDARYKMSYRISEPDLDELRARVAEMAARIRKACIERLGTFLGAERVSGNLPEAPSVEDTPLEALPLPGDPKEAEAWKRDLIARSELRGEARGLVEGEIRGEAKAVIRVLEARGIVVDEKVRARVLGCRDEAVISGWLTKAVSVGRAEELFELLEDGFK